MSTFESRKAKREHERHERHEREEARRQLPKAIANGTIAFVAIGAVIVLLAFLLRPKQFTDTNYVGVKTNISYTEVSLTDSPKEDRVELQKLSAGTPVTMTGELFGERGEFSHLSAEVRLADGTKGWVPLLAVVS